MGRERLGRAVDRLFLLSLLLVLCDKIDIMKERLAKLYSQSTNLKVEDVQLSMDDLEMIQVIGKGSGGGVQLVTDRMQSMTLC
ncbi:hypothetical protein SORBI_3003G240800 [Sorghum bicolor]|uniref:Uncharacterized protein n=1 Tax=Sorghum bicolor TaxID=4558 RepID=A0A1B6Q517_SORBI|nr:hypothetical protein SORBI_3003G240800 [Sorghum bicolor]